MGDLKSPRVIKLKGILFLVIGVVSAAMLVVENPSWRHTLLLAICLWGCCRFYYFAFYVIEHYVDSKFKFAGLWDFAMYLLRRRRSPGR